MAAAAGPVSPQRADIATENHCLYAFDVLAAHFERGPEPAAGFVGGIECPLFVTWHKREHGLMQLRGCIGCLSPLPLTSGLRDYALTSALRDRRFQPMQHAELPELECSVQLLSGFEQAAHCTDWVIGTHGVTIEFKDPSGTSRSAVYLPDVIPEQGWTHDETIESLIRKSGYTRAITPELKARLRTTRYISTKWTVPYERWAAMRHRVAA